MTTSYLGKHHIHAHWDRKIKPVMEIMPGKELFFDLPDASNGEVTHGSTAEQIGQMDFRKMDPLIGPIWVEGAEPGDALEIEILEIKPKRFGWTGLLPNFGLLADHFTEPRLTIWDLDDQDEIDVYGTKFKLNPMLGCIGVAPGQDGQYASVTPTYAGGNIDVKYVVAGSRLFLPVQNPGALLSVADGHALQGDGEISGTAIECPVDTNMKVHLHKGMNLRAPQVVTGPIKQTVDEGYRIFTGIGPDLMQAAREACLQATEGLAKSLKIDETDAYNLLGILGDLRIHEIVDQPNWVVGCMLPGRFF
jgi:acetamidase/formamidase